jgi:hypothetical protein
MTELPIACTLGAADFRKQTALIRDLSRGALLASRRGPLTLQLTYHPSATTRVEELVRQERSCCAFLQFDLTTDAAGVHLTITAPQRAQDAVDLLFAPYVEPSSAGTGVGTDPMSLA